MNLAPLGREDVLRLAPGTTWLYTGAEGPPLVDHADALQCYLADRAMGEKGRARNTEIEQSVRRGLADLMGLQPSDVALVGNASEAMNIVARAFDFVPGDNVVLNDIEFPSVVLPWLRMRGDGVEIRIARSKEGRLPYEDLAPLVDGRTRAVILSHVSYMTGWRHDLPAIGALADSVGAYVVLDATQSLGVVPVPGSIVDVVISSSYKWLLGGHGTGVLAWNSSRRAYPSQPASGWRSGADLFSGDRFAEGTPYADARRWELGFPSYPTLYQLERSLHHLGLIGIPAIERHVLALGAALISALHERGCTVLTSDTGAERAGNIAVRCAQGEAVAERLAEAGVHCWGGDGRLRMSVHFFNGSDDVARLLEAIDALPSELHEHLTNPSADITTAALGAHLER